MQQKTKNHKNIFFNQFKDIGFTIVELLVVITIIGILAAITMVSYSGIIKKVDVAVLQSDLKNASTILEMDKILNGSYPTTEAAANNGTGLPKSSGTVYEYSLVGDGYYIKATSTKDTSISYYISSNSGTAIKEVTRWMQVSSFGESTCALTVAGKAYCWGWNMHGQIGDGTTNDSVVPVAVDMSILGDKTFKYISVGYYESCAIDTDGQVYCWGLDIYNGQSRTTPVNISSSGDLNGKEITAISTGNGASCAIDNAGKAYCWGDNYYGQVGAGSSSTSSLMPTEITMDGALVGKTIKSISAGYSHICAIASDDQVYCWGRNDNGQLGNNSTANSNVPVAVNTSGLLSDKTIKTVSAGNNYSCVVASDDNLYCWGSNYDNMLGDGGSSDSSVPVASIASGDLNGKKVKYISLGSPYSRCLLGTDSLAYCRGDNSVGELGNNNNVDNDASYSAVYTAGALSGKTIKSLESGDKHTCVIASDDQIYCWGWFINDIEDYTNAKIAPVIVLL